MKESGLWHLPNSKTKIPGKLFVDNSKNSIILKLYTKSYLSGSVFEFASTKRKDEYIEIILGDIRNGPLGDVTLYGCSFARLAPIAGDLYELHYRIQFIFNYVHILKRSHLKFNYVEVLFPNSDNFFNGWESVNREESNSKNEYVKITNNLKINKQLNIDVVDTRRETVSMSKDYEIKHSNHLTFNYTDTIDIDVIYKDCNTFQKLMEFSGRRSLAFIIKNAKTEFKYVNGERQLQNLVRKNTEDERDKMAHTYIYSRLTLNQEPFENTSKLNQNWLLFSDWTESKQSLNNLITNWFKNESLHPIYEFYLDTVDWGKNGAISNVNFNNRYLNLMQGLEAYYDFLNPDYQYKNENFIVERQKVYDALESKELKRWVGNHLKFPKQANFSDKLKFLCEKYMSILSNLNTNSQLIESYSYKAKEYRHKLSHGKINKTFQGKDLHSLYGFSQVLLCICILDSIGMEHIKIADRINSNPDINRQIPR